MFETATLSYGPSAKRAWTTAMGFTCQALLVGCALLAPMISPQSLPRVTWITSLAPPGPPPPPPPPPGGQVAARTHAPVSQMDNHRLLLPTMFPSKPLILTDPEPALLASGAGVPGGVMGGSENGVPGGVLSDILNEAARILPVVRPPEVIRKEAPAAPATLVPPRVTMLKMATPIRKVEPLYPVLAKQARISGTVELLGVLGTDGRIHELKVLRGHPLLVNAAVDAVRQWVFEPTMLNGKAVEVAAPIIVNFILN